MRLLLRVLVGALALDAAVAAASPSALSPLAADLRGAVMVAPATLSPPARQAVDLFVEEVARRSGEHWSHAARTPGAGRPLIVIEARDQRLPAEGYRIATDVAHARITITPADDRGVLYGVGHLLRSLALSSSPSRAGLVAPLNLTSAPRYPLRGIQLGFRAMSNTYGNWTLAQFEQQIRDLAVFGCNAIELVAGFDRESPGALTMSSLDNMVGVSRLCASYGLDVWLWTPAREKDYARPESVARSLRDWETIFRAVPRLDGIYVPGGDPGDTPPELLLPLVEKQAALARKYHPHVKVWISPQGFGRTHLDAFFRYLTQTKPAWLDGVIAAPWTDASVAQIRARTPARYAVRHNIDIGHVLHSQFPVQDLDTAFAITQGREPICPRPFAMQAIARAELPPTCGSIAYSDGVTDDVNKIAWLQYGWNPDTSPTDILREYGRYFLGEKLGDDFASGVAMLERNWQGPLAENAQVAATLLHFQSLEHRATPAELRNWRFLSALYRAYYDRYVQRRLVHESALEARANAILAQAATLGADPAMRDAEAQLGATWNDVAAAAERARVFELGDALHDAIGMKLSVSRHRATSITRGANLDSIDWPLNNRLWLAKQFAAIRALPVEAERRARLLALAHWTEPGPGGFYDDPGRPGGLHGAKIGPCAGGDPGGQASAQEMKAWMRLADFSDHRIAWLDHVGTLGETPLVFAYDGLDPHASYELRVVYGDTKLNGPVRLTANDTFEIHPLRKGPVPAAPQTFTVPRAATQSGHLMLKWERDPTLPSIKGVCHVSEIWLVKKSAP